jgi:hypothetical protein
MGQDFSTLVYAPNFTMFSRPVTFIPVFGGSYGGRAIWHSDTVSVPLDDGSVLSDQQTTVDILEADFTSTSIPVQGDHILIGPDGNVPAEGEFEIINVWRNGGGETTLQLREVKVAS